MERCAGIPMTIPSPGEKEIIAEDLGFITSSTRKLLSGCGFYCMKVLEFAFDIYDQHKGKPLIFLATTFGREIADVLIAVNRSYNKSDYIPCIAWGRNAKYAETLKVGDNVVIRGRIQSRDYQKKISETEVETKTAYEVSVSRLEMVENIQSKEFVCEDI